MRNSSYGLLVRRNCSRTMPGALKCPADHEKRITAHVLLLVQACRVKFLGMIPLNRRAADARRFPRLRRSASSGNRAAAEPSSTDQPTQPDEPSHPDPPSHSRTAPSRALAPGGAASVPPPRLLEDAASLPEGAASQPEASAGMCGDASGLLGGQEPQDSSGYPFLPPVKALAASVSRQLRRAKPGSPAHDTAVRGDERGCAEPQNEQNTTGVLPGNQHNTQHSKQDNKQHSKQASGVTVARTKQLHIRDGSLTITGEAKRAGTEAGGGARGHAGGAVYVVRELEGVDAVEREVGVLCSLVKAGLMVPRTRAEAGSTLRVGLPCLHVSHSAVVMGRVSQHATP
jgi:hypothetical protein